MTTRPPDARGTATNKMSPGARPVGAPSPPPPARPGIVLAPAELWAVLRLVEDCERAPTLPLLRETALEGLARHLGYRHGAFFVGSSLERAFQDRHPAGRGIGLRLAEAFMERYRTFEAFTDADSLTSIRGRGLLTLRDFGPPDRPEIRAQLQETLTAHGIRAKLLVRLTTPAGVGGFVSLSDPRPGAFGPRDRVVCGVVGRHLGNLLGLHSQELSQETAPSVTASLSARECDVAALVAEGHANRQIAEALGIGVDAVKHHMKRALQATGLANRTQLALAWQREVATPSPVGSAGKHRPAWRAPRQ